MALKVVTMAELRLEVLVEADRMCPSWRIVPWYRTTAERAPSTISWEVNHDGGRGRYSAVATDEAACRRPPTAAVHRPNDEHEQRHHWPPMGRTSWPPTDARSEDARTRCSAECQPQRRYTDGCLENDRKGYEAGQREREAQKSPLSHGFAE